jgi:sugar lactone lactonase YvrE
MVEPRVVLTDIVLGESTRWHDGRVLFSDWGAGEIIAVTDGAKDVVARVEGMPFCFDWLPDGRMISTQGTAQRMIRWEADGTLVTHADLTPLGVTSPWNDIAADSLGNAFINNIGYDFPGGEPQPGFVAVVTPDGRARRVAGDLLFPNGMAVTADDATLIVAESHAGRLTAFDIGTDGELTNQRLWAQLEGAAPDGICIDAEDAVWYADVPNQQCVRVREGGEILATVTLDRGGFACALSPDGTLYAVTADYSNPDAMLQGIHTGQLVAADVGVGGIR